jgi:hypothetical protein
MTLVDVIDAKRFLACAICRNQLAIPGSFERPATRASSSLDIRTRVVPGHVQVELPFGDLARIEIGDNLLGRYAFSGPAAVTRGGKKLALCMQERYKKRLVFLPQPNLTLQPRLEGACGKGAKI